MKEEQIKQNAEKYADKAAPITEQKTGIPLAIHTAAEVAYLVGAHSRDKEIAELKERLKFADDSIVDADKWITKYKLDIAKLEAKLDQLRNPWISVEDMLPEDDKTVLVWFGGCYTVAVLRDNEWWECTGYQTGGGWSALDKIPDIASSYITHWMSIPALNPAEQLISGLQEMNQQFKKGE